MEQNLASLLEIDKIKEFFEKDTKLSIKELSDGNINYIFLIENSNKKSAIIKYAENHLRIDKNWKLNQVRLKFEVKYLEIANEFAPDFVPKLIYSNLDNKYFVIMENLQPAITLRNALVEGKQFKNVAKDLGTFLSRMHFYTSDFFLDLQQKTVNQTFFSGNFELLKLTEQVIFEEPYIICKNNNYLPELEDLIQKEIQKDSLLKTKVWKLKEKFRNFPQALLHGDFHTGSIMVEEKRTSVIDSEFAFYGPVGFDLGKILGNFIINFVTLHGHFQDQKLSSQREWILSVIKTIWNEWKTSFVNLWKKEAKGSLFNHFFAQNSMEHDLFIEDYIKTIFSECIGYAGCCILRRIIGIASVQDFLSIKDREKRVECEKKGLKIGEYLIKSASFNSIEALAQFLNENY